jgi:hypothetical protein
MLLWILVLAARAAAPGDLTFTEVMAEPGVVPNFRGEWFEIRNNTGATIDLAGAVVADTAGQDAGFTVSGALLVPPGGLVVFGVDADRAANGDVPVDAVYARASLPLDHQMDGLRLIIDGVEVDRVAWGAGWPTGVGTAMQASSAGDPPVLANPWANDGAGRWCAAAELAPAGWAGSPGAPNPLCPGDDADDDGDGWAEVDGDCDDADPAVHPGAVDGDGAPHGAAGDDGDCDGLLDDGLTDDDGDGWAEVDGDCDDGDPAVHPGAGEVADGRDEDCNGCVDDLDGDGDGATACPAPALRDCDPADAVDCAALAALSDAPEGACADAVDCDDGDATAFPCAPEVPYDGRDQSCDGRDACDLDGDGFRAVECPGAPAPADGRPGDCDDGDAAVRPGGDEGDAPNGKDDDCDGLVDEPWGDADGDGVPAEAGDCRDDPSVPGAREVFPGATERCDNRRDDDCDGFMDEGCPAPDAEARLGGGGACAGAPGGGAGGAAAVAGLALLVRVRRRSRR